MNETNEASLNRKDLFLGLVHSFQAAAMQQMGKTMNPYTQKVERDLKHARMSIDMLEMLQERTSGNLTGEESRFLTHVLTELRLNYVAEVDEDRKTGAKPEAEEAAEGAESKPEAKAP
ncbi:MAG TPA: DUF1844 domain-containing protein [Candidatus Eisenbacteria bacterium]|jgi:hypothetical protein|nr:DUF1844 domain-containing protein [Candidatus Eisenbacteria bacterium]